METDIHSIPDRIFDWMHRSTFQDLDAAKQAEVLRYFTAETFNDMHEVIRDVQNNIAAEPLRRRQDIKQNLLREFDKQHQASPNTRSFLLYPVAMWKVAATIVFLASAGLWLSQKDAPIADRSLLAQADTVYITKQVMLEPERIYDTVYITENTQPEYKTAATANPQSQEENIQSNGNYTVSPPNFREHVVTVDELNKYANRQKNNSMKDDSLERNFSFVML